MLKIIELAGRRSVGVSGCRRIGMLLEGSRGLGMVWPSGALGKERVWVRRRVGKALSREKIMRGVEH